MVKRFIWDRLTPKFLLWFCAILSGLLLLWHLLSMTDSYHPVLARRVQQSVLRLDKELYSFENKLLSSNDLEQILTEEDRRYTFFENQGCFIYHSDTLYFWNNNQIEPRLLRKNVRVPSDTIIHLNTTDVLVHSFAESNYSIYLFTVLAIRHGVENDYLVGPSFHLPSSYDVQFSSTQAPYPVYGLDGSILSYFTLTSHGVGSEKNHAFPLVCLMVLLFSVYLLCCRRVSARSFASASSTKKPRHFLPVVATIAFLLFVVVVFRVLCRYFFAHGFFLPDAMHLDLSFFYLFVFLLLLLTLTLLLKRLYFRHLPYSSRNEFYFMILQLFVLGILLTVLYDREYTRTENMHIKTLAEDLAQERDPAFEDSYLHFLSVAPYDTTFFTTLLSEDVMEAVAEDYLRSFLFDSILNQYSVSATLCSPGMELVVQPYDEIAECNEYFQTKVNDNHGIDLDSGLYFLDYNTLDPSYLSSFNFVIGDSVSERTVYLEFTKPIAPQGFGLPKILQDDKSLLPVGYSVACYQDSLLIYKYGPYVYPNYLSNYRHEINGFIYGRKQKHYTYQSDDGKVLALSLPRRDWMKVTTPFVVFFSMLVVLFLFVYFFGGIRRHYPRPSMLSNKFQMVVLIALGLSFVVVGPVSVFYMQSFYTQKTQDYHFERIKTLLLDITGEVDFSFLRQPGFKYELDEVLKHYSETFFTDINIYGLNGKMLATTSPELIDMHLQSSLMNAEAFHQLQGDRSLYYIHNESTGKVSYQSAYIPIQDAGGKIMAYLNTPYYASRSELRSEIRNYILTYINIIFVLVAFIFCFLLYMTRRLTDPLKSLQEKIGKFDLNGANEILDWSSDDEIGDLVRQYNQLVVALRKSAEELRRTTTENAWRSVARQVAHEIKNSLTPMRLSVQLLQHSIAQGSATPEQIQRTTNTIIEQIDTLSDIASSFSSYAKLPENHPQPFDLSELVGNLVTLYDNEDNITFQYEYDPALDYTFNGDKTNLNSAVSNLIKNAVQAIGNAREGHIRVRLDGQGGRFVIAVKDNGKGIKEEDKSMIFLPNFTTKSSGSGVGLSLTYNIVKAAGGTISFDSKEGEGAEFVIELPKS